MKKLIALKIDCGETTCARARGEFCRYFGSMKFGTVPVCTLFPGETSHTVLDASGDWTQRCPACKAAEYLMEDLCRKS